MDCSQAYHCLQMADQRSIEMLALTFTSRTFAYRRSAQGLSRALSAFSRFKREYLDKVINAHNKSMISASRKLHLATHQEPTGYFPMHPGCRPETHNAQTSFWCKGKWLPDRTITSVEYVRINHDSKNFVRTQNFRNPRKLYNNTCDFSTTTAITYPGCQKSCLVTQGLLDKFTEINKALDRWCELALNNCYRTSKLPSWLMSASWLLVMQS